MVSKSTLELGTGNVVGILTRLGRSGGLTSQLINGPIAALTGAWSDVVDCLIVLCFGPSLTIGKMVSAMVGTIGLV